MEEPRGDIRTLVFKSNSLNCLYLFCFTLFNVCVCMCTCVSQNAGTYVHICVGQRSTSYAIPQAQPIFIGHRSLTGLEFAEWAMLAGLRTPGVLLSQLL